jgi:hypothetical protein
MPIIEMSASCLRQCHQQQKDTADPIATSAALSPALFDWVPIRRRPSQGAFTKHRRLPLPRYSRQGHRQGQPHPQAIIDILLREA